MTKTDTSAGITAKIFLGIAIVGAVNWGLIGFFNYNLVDAIFGGGSRETTGAVSRVIYALVGLAGVLGAFMLPRLHDAAVHKLSERVVG